MLFPLSFLFMDSTNARSAGLWCERAERVRICSHARNTRVEIDALVTASDAWTVGIKQGERASLEGRSTQDLWSLSR